MHYLKKRRSTSLVFLLIVCFFLSIGTIPHIADLLEGNNRDAKETNNKLSVSGSRDYSGIPISNVDRYSIDAELIRDIFGGYVFAWCEERNGDQDVYCQRVNSNGQFNWSANGIPLCTVSGDQAVPKLVSDGVGGAVVAWLDNRSGEGYQVYAQRINSMGETLWPANGVLLSNLTIYHYIYELVSDGFGGAIVAWISDMEATGRDVYAQRINKDGMINWTEDGVPVCTASGTQYELDMASDDSGGAVIAWEDMRYPERGVYIQRVNITGHALWTSNGTAICSVMSVRGCHPRIINDGTGTGSVIVSWCDYRNEAGGDSFAQKFNSTGHAQWAPEGVPICTALSSREYASPLVSDGAGGAIIAWDESRYTGPSSPYYQQVYAQRITSEGQANWSIEGVLICSGFLYATNTQIASDNSGGAVITWRDDRNSDFSYNPNIFAQKVNSSGHIQWRPNGTEVCSNRGWQTNPRMVSDGEDGAVISWSDGRNENYAIYAQRINSEGEPLWWRSSSGSLGISVLDLAIFVSIVGVISVLSISLTLVVVKKRMQ